MSLFKNVRPGIKLHFLSQKIDAKGHSAKVDFWSEIQCVVQSTLHLTQGIVSMILKQSVSSFICVLVRNEWVDYEGELVGGHDVHPLACDIQL